MGLKVTVCCCTYRRPVLLSHMIECFQQQSYQNRHMVILDDSPCAVGASGDRWEIVTSARFPTLGAKRNACAEMASDDTDALVVWDDDDLYFPWALQATAAALENADWSRPSEFLMLDDDYRLHKHETFSREDRKDKCCQSSWGIRVDTFWNAGGYDKQLSMGEDKALALAIEGAAECDPITLGYEPWYVFSPYHNVHLSDLIQEYNDFDGGVRNYRFVTLAALKMESALPRAEQRPWKTDWYGGMDATPIQKT